MKGVKIGYGSVIAARSLIDRKVESATIAAGSPAKTVKTAINWRGQETGLQTEHEID